MRTPIRGFLLGSWLLFLPAAAAWAAVLQVSNSGFTFVPADLTVQVGDTVQWNWTSGSHTVTNGLDLADPQVGALFDAPLTAAAPIFSYTFTTAGDFPYFCRPHRSLGMTGIVHVEAPTAAGGSPLRNAVTLYQNAPNPFNPTTVIRFDLPQAVPVRLDVIDVAGRRIRALLAGETLAAGPQQAAWNGRDRRGRPQPAGVYFYRLETPGFSRTLRMTLVK